MACEAPREREPGCGPARARWAAEQQVDVHRGAALCSSGERSRIVSLGVFPYFYGLLVASLPASGSQ